VTTDVALVALPSLAFGLLVTTHLFLCLWLATRPPRYRGLLALVVPPLAPYWAYLGERRRLAVLWVGAFAAYVAALGVAATS